ncbi:MAG: glycosyltransferase family 2 protein [Clostridia bacterium]|nr:glycosyltransferase family 2 protein [Clostridia bacterium]
MRFSVVIPVYNAEKYLKECIASLLSQEGAPAFELVFIDDGSTDGSGSLLDEAAANDPHVRVAHTENRGSILARKAGIMAARGEYILFCDADDRYRPGCMHTVDALLRNSGADILVWNHAILGADGSVKDAVPVFADGERFAGEGKQRFYRETIAGWRLNTLWNKAFRRELLQADPTELAPYAGNPLGDDLLAGLWALTQAQSIVYSCKVLYEYRTTPGGLTQTFDERRFRRAKDTRISELLRSYLPVWGMDTEEYRVLFARRCLLDRTDVAMSAFRRAADAAAERNVLRRDWFSGLPTTEEETGKAKAALPKKARIQYELIRMRCRLLLHLLTGKVKT